MWPEARLVGEIAVTGPERARSLTDLGLIDEYRLPAPHRDWSRQAILRRPPVRRVSTDSVGEDMVRLTYVPA